jgi:thymidylate kinase
MLWSVVDDVSRDVDVEPKFVEGLLAPKIYALFSERGLGELKDIALHLLHEMAGVHENVYYLDVPKEELARRNAKRFESGGKSRIGMFDKIATTDKFENFYNALMEAYEVLGAQRINADVPFEKMEDVADEIIERSGI